MDIATDDEGFLVDRSQWSRTVAQSLASAEGITLTPAHWEILGLVQDFFSAYEHAPAMRALVSYVAQELGAEKGRSIYLLQLFPGSPAKRAARIAGLPRPENCL